MAAADEAESCWSFASNGYAFSDSAAWFDDDDWLHIRDEAGEKFYGTLGAGTGIPWRAAQPVDGKGKELAFIFHKGDLIIDLEVFVPNCRK